MDYLMVEQFNNHAGRVKQRSWKNKTSSGGTVEKWKRDGGTVEPPMLEQWNNHGQTVEHLMVKKFNI